MKLTKMLRVAWKGLAANKLRTFLMMLGIIVGIAALTLIMAVGQGAKAELVQKADKMFAQAPITVLAMQPGTGFVRGSAGMSGVPPTLTTGDAQAILEQVRNVRLIGPTQNEAQVPIKHKERSTQTMVFGVVPDWQVLRNYQVVEGDFVNDEDLASAARVCVVGQAVVEELFPETDPIDETIRIEGTPFRVKGVLSAKGASPSGGNFDDRVVIPLSTFSRRLYNLDHLTRIVIGLEDVQRMDETAGEITGLLRERHGTRSPDDDDFTVRQAEGVVQVASKTSRTLSVFLGIVAAISLLVGGVVVTNIMLISVGERRNEIGVRRAVGARRRDIIAQFWMEALLVTGIGGVCGVVLGMAASSALPLFTQVKTASSWQAVAVATLFAIGVGLVSGVQPARRAANLNPVDALRSE